MFAGEMSRWTTPRSWQNAAPSAASATIRSGEPRRDGPVRPVDPSGEGLPAAQLHRQVVQPVGPAGFEHPDHVRVFERGQSPLVQEPPPRLRIEPRGGATA